jgi:outer membrane protein assembly factor BamB
LLIDMKPTILLIALLLAAPAFAEHWPQWRGPNGNGVSGEIHLPTKWSETENIAWKLPLPGPAGATPAVWGDRIFLTTIDNGEVALMCVTTAGKELWKRTVGKGGGKSRGDEGNNASPSPSTDGKHVWAFFGTGDLVCFDFDGNQVWHADIQQRYGKFHYGFGQHMTPLLDGDRLYLQLIHSKTAHVVALDKTTGDEIWKVERKSDGHSECYHSYASPILWRSGDSALLVTHGNDYAIGHKLTDGGEVFRVADLNPKSKYNATLRFVASPVATADLIVVPTAKNGPVVAIKPSATGLITAGTEGEAWRRPNNTPDVPSPLVHEGLVYLCRESGVLLCIDAKTGQELYQERLHNHKHRGSPVYADGKVYTVSRDGVVCVVKAGRKFELLATNKLNDQIAASPVVAGGRIYLRGFEHLYAIGK